VATSLLPEEINLLITDSKLPQAAKQTLVAANIKTEYV